MIAFPAGVRVWLATGHTDNAAASFGHRRRMARWRSPGRNSAICSKASIGAHRNARGDRNLPGKIARPIDSSGTFVARHKRSRAFLIGMALTADSLPDDVATLKAMVIAGHAVRLAAEAEAKARALLIEQMKFTIAKLRHEQYGQSSERSAVLEQLELQLADLEENASQAEAQAQMAAAAAAEAKIKVEGFQRKRPARRPLPEHLPRERLVHPAPTACRTAAAARCARSARM